MSDWNQFTVNSVDPMQSMAKAFGIAGAAQNLKNSQVQGQILSQNAQQGDIDLSETQKYRGIVQNIKNYQNEQGDLDFSKLIPDVMSAAPKNGPTFLQQLATAQTTATTSKREINSLTDEDRARIGNVLATIPKGTPPEKVAETLGLLNQYTDGKMPTAASNAINAYTTHFKQGGADDAYGILQTMSRSILTPPVQQAMNTPEGVQVSNGQTSSFISTKPGTSVPQGKAIPGTSVQMQLPPTTQVFNPETQQPGYFGPQGKGLPDDSDRVRILKQELSRATNPADKAAIERELSHVTNGRFVASGPALGQAQNVASNFEEMNRHYGSLNDQATGNQLAQGLTGNIKALADSAITGTEAGRKSYLTGLLNALHLGNKATGDLQKDSDLLEKNLAQLNLSSPASSDAARALVTASRPHSGMSAEAIKEAAGQVAGQIQANVAMRNMLTPYKLMGDVNGYTAARQKLESIADPRAFQFHSLPPEERVEMLKKLTPQDRQELRGKIDQLDKMGMFK